MHPVDLPDAQDKTSFDRFPCLNHIQKDTFPGIRTCNTCRIPYEGKYNNRDYPYADV